MFLPSGYGPVYLYNVHAILSLLIFLINVVDYPLLFSNVCLKKCATPLYLKSIQSIGMK